jgi:hypothetical protein
MSVHRHELDLAALALDPKMHHALAYCPAIMDELSELFRVEVSCYFSIPVRSTTTSSGKYGFATGSDRSPDDTVRRLEYGSARDAGIPTAACNHTFRTKASPPTMAAP